LEKSVTVGKTLMKSQAREYEFIDKKRVKGMMIAEKNVAD
jgi:hypothetical protein